MTHDLTVFIYFPFLFSQSYEWFLKTGDGNQFLEFLVFRRKDLCEAKQNVECSKKRSKYYAMLWGGGVKHSVLNINAIE